MKYDEFICHLQTRVQQHTGKMVNVDLRRVTKNNGVEMDGLSMSEEGQKISPMIYLKDYFASYEKGVTIPEIVEEILKVYEENKISNPLAPEFYTNFEKVQDRLVCKLINYDKNRELLQKIPYIRWLDLAIVFYYVLENEEFNNGTILIYNSHLEMWKVSLEVIYEAARRNTLHMLPHEFRSMYTIIEDTFEVEDLGSDTEAVPMYILTNTSKSMGAVSIIYDAILSKIGEELGADFYILPSSVHECVIVPEHINTTKEALQRMVAEINETQVLPEEILSDNIYYYNRKKHHLSL